ncbi:hypothetical protein C8J56DRAFT_892477 [Mycena floridula]|nr:hypothetical protein C8J56DRAFT_892477 [Mycena floridula]
MDKSNKYLTEVDVMIDGQAVKMDFISQQMKGGFIRRQGHPSYVYNGYTTHLIRRLWEEKLWEWKLKLQGNEWASKQPLAIHVLAAQVLEDSKSGSNLPPSTETEAEPHLAKIDLKIIKKNLLQHSATRWLTGWEEGELDDLEDGFIFNCDWNIIGKDTGEQLQKLAVSEALEKRLTGKDDLFGKWLDDGEEFAQVKIFYQEEIISLVVKVVSKDDLDSMDLILGKDWLDRNFNTTI